MRLLVWNLEWKRPRSKRGRAILERIQEIDPDLAILTEAGGSFFSSGSSATGARDWGYDAPEWRDKVQIWSRQPWRDVDTHGSELLPGGRFVSGTTDTPFGATRVIGVCIPWRDAHVNSGRRDRARWEDHLSYLAGLRSLLEETDAPCVLAGDWNQRIPRKYQPKRIFQALQESLPESFEVLTSGNVSPLDTQLIDHVAIQGELTVESVRGVSREHETLGRLTDHHGVVVDFVDGNSG